MSDDRRPVRAYITECIGVRCVVFTRSGAGRARYRTYLSAKEAGYRVSLTGVTLRREPGLDTSWCLADGRSYPLDRPLNPDLFKPTINAPAWGKE